MTGRNVELLINKELAGYRKLVNCRIDLCWRKERGKVMNRKPFTISSDKRETRVEIRNSEFIQYSCFLFQFSINFSLSTWSLKSGLSDYGYGLKWGHLPSHPSNTAAWQWEKTYPDRDTFYIFPQKPRYTTRGASSSPPRQEKALHQVMKMCLTLFQTIKDLIRNKFTIIYIRKERCIPFLVGSRQ